MQEISQIEKKLKYTFKNKHYLLNALIHRSFRGNNPKIKSNERIEFLGDAVLELIVSEHLYLNYPDIEEGDLTKIRSKLVRTESLASIVKEMQINKYIKMSKSEKITGGMNKQYILANIYESIVGAIFLDSGIDDAKIFINRTVLKNTNNIIKNKLYNDPKTQLQEITQAAFKQIPTYTIIKTEGPAHDRTFTCAVTINKKEISKGIGSSKQKAEEQAAENALLYLSKDKGLYNL